MNFRIGHGYDVHRLTENRDLILGGVKIPYPLGLDGHSDADVLLHAVCDAILGACALGDIGKHFPDTDDTYLGVSSMVLLQKVVKLSLTRGFAVGNIDVTVVAQAPKLSGYVSDMCKNIAKCCQVSLDCVNVKSTTEEGIGFTGNGLAIAAHSVCIMEEI